MRFHFVAQLENEDMLIDYRRKIVAFFKHALSQSDSGYYNDLYGNGNNTNKDFTFSVYFLPETQIEKERIRVQSKKLIINLSTSEAYLGLQLYNALIKQKFSWFRFSPENAIRIIEIHLEKEKIITQRSVRFNTLSPMIIRDHNQETGKDWFYTFEDSQAVPILKRNLQNELAGKFDRSISHDIDKLKIEFIRMKKVVVKSYELKIPCSLGTFCLEGEQYLLQYLYQRGIGSKRSMGYGMLEA